MGDQYIVTIRDITKHIGRIYNNGSTVSVSIEELTATVLNPPRNTIAPNTSSGAK